jgi:hypothetical protein
MTGRLRGLPAFPWALWTVARASCLYVAGKIDADEWHTRIHLARVAAGTDEADADEAAGKTASSPPEQETRS